MLTLNAKDELRSLKLRLPSYAVALVLSYLSEAIGKIAGRIARDGAPFWKRAGPGKR